MRPLECWAAPSGGIVRKNDRAHEAVGLGIILYTRNIELWNTSSRLAAPYGARISEV